MNIDQIINLNSIAENNGKDSIMNERTVGKMVIDFEYSIAKVWLRREEDKGWIEYPLDFI